MVAELVSTLTERHLGSLPGSHHRVRVSLAERPLSWRQTGDPVADDTGAESDNRRQRAVKEEKEDHGHDADTPRWSMEETPTSVTTYQRPN